MNMISTGAFLPEMDASNKQETMAEKFARVWEKKNSKVARAGGVSLMALSLAACGSSNTATPAATTDTDTNTDTDTDTDTDTTPVLTSPSPRALETTADSIFGTSPSATTTGNDTFTATVAATGSTLTSGDVIADSSADDNDTLTITSSVATVDTGVATIVGIENVNVDFAVFGTATVDAEGVKSGTLTVNQTQAGANGNATINGAVGSIAIVAGTDIDGTVTVNNITAGSTVTVDAGDAATVTTTTAGAAGTMTITGGSKLTQTDTVAAEQSITTTAETSATINIDGVGTTAGDTATISFGKLAGVANGAADTVETINISSSFAATSTATATATITNAAATLYNVTGTNDVTLAGHEDMFSGKTLTDNSSGTTTVSITTLDTTDLSKIGADIIEIAADASNKTVSMNDGVTVKMSSDINAGGLTLDADDDVTDTATTYLKGSVTIDLATDDIDGGTLTVDNAGASDDGYDNIHLVVTKAQDATGLDLRAGTGVVTAEGAAALIFNADTTAKSIDASQMTGAVTYTYDNTNDVATVTTGEGGDTITNGTTAIGTKATISTKGGNDTITMLSTAKADINGGDGYDKVTIAGDAGSLTFAEIEEVNLSGDVTGAKATMLSGQSYIMSGAQAWTFGTAASQFDTNDIDLSKLVINNVTGFTVDVSNGLSPTVYTSVEAVTVTGSSIADTIKGTANGDNLSGGDAGDTITGNAGTDTIDGGAGTDVLHGDNAGDKAIETYTVTTAGAGTATLTILGDTFTATYATTGDAVIADLQTALAADSNYGVTFTSEVTANAGTTTDDVLTVTYLVDGVQNGSATTSTTTLAINTTGANGTDVVGTVTSAGTAGTNGMDTFTGGSEADTFVISANESGGTSAVSATVYDTILDFEGNKDVIDYADNVLSIEQNATATSGTAKITAAGVATFHADDDTFALQLAAVEAAIQTGTATAGQAAVWQDGSDAWLFISDGVDGVDANDALVKLVGLDLSATTSDTLTIAADGDATIA